MLRSMCQPCHRSRVGALLSCVVVLAIVSVWALQVDGEEGQVGPPASSLAQRPEGSNSSSSSSSTPSSMSPSPLRSTSVAAMAIMKGEARTVVEWVEYHLLIGVELFLLFSNECDDKEDALVDGLLQPYTAAGLVVVDKRFRCATKFQTSAYRAGLQWFRDHHPMEWVGVFDVDEFFIVQDSARFVVDVLQPLEQHTPAVAAVSFNRLFFGTNSHVQRPVGSVLGAYQRHGVPFHALPPKRPKDMKMWVRPKLCTNVRTHGCYSALAGAVRSVVLLSDKVVPLDYSGKVLWPNSFAWNGSWFNHYYTKSEEDWRVKNLRGDAVFGARESRKVAMPPGLNAVFNTVVVQGVWQRLADLASTIPSSPTMPPGSLGGESLLERSRRLQAILLTGAPTKDECVAAGGSPVWGPEFIADGLVRLQGMQ